MSEQPDKPLLKTLGEPCAYPPEAIEFVQQGLSYTVEHVHGEIADLEKQLYRSMAERELDYNQLCKAYHDGLLDDETVDLIDQLGGIEEINRHVSGEQLCWGLRELALGRWGMMTRTVLRKWSINTTLDFGKIVFLLVEENKLQRQPDDSIDDFADVYDFRTAFEPDPPS